MPLVGRSTSFPSFVTQLTQSKCQSHLSPTSSDGKSMRIMAPDKKLNQRELRPGEEKSIPRISQLWLSARTAVRSSRNRFFAIPIVFDWCDTCAIYWYTRITFNWRNFNSISTFIWIYASIIYFIRLVRVALCRRIHQQQQQQQHQMRLYGAAPDVYPLSTLSSSSFPSLDIAQLTRARPLRDANGIILVRIQTYYSR